jgi:hypothetical protein
MNQELFEPFFDTLLRELGPLTSALKSMDSIRQIIFIR